MVLLLKLEFKGAKLFSIWTLTLADWCWAWAVVGHDVVGGDMAAGGTYSSMSASFLPNTGEDTVEAMLAALAATTTASGNIEGALVDHGAAAQLSVFRVISTLLI